MTTAPTTMTQSAGGVGTVKRASKFVDRWLIPVYVFFALFYLILPILVMIAFSFNDPPGKFNFVWGQFSLSAWMNPFGRPGLQDALVTSLVVAVVSTIIATILSLLAVLGLGLACLGVYGVFARTVAQRTGEFGIRLALGARARDITRLVLTSGAKLALIGNTAPVAYGALGIPLITLDQITGLGLQPLSEMVGRQLPFFSLLVPFWLVAAQAGGFVWVAGSLFATVALAFLLKGMVDTRQSATVCVTRGWSGISRSPTRFSRTCCGAPAARHRRRWPSSPSK